MNESSVEDVNVQSNAGANNEMMHFVSSFCSACGILLAVILAHSRWKSPALDRKCQPFLQLLLSQSRHFMTPVQEDFQTLFSSYFQTALILINHLMNPVSLLHQRRLLVLFVSPGLLWTSAMCRHAREEKHLL